MKNDKNYVLTLVRHAESCGNAGIFYEDEYLKDDPPLSPLGLKQAELLAQSKLLENADVIFSSTLIRAVQTVYPSAQKIGKNIILLSDLMEINTEIPGTEYSRLNDNFPLAVACISEPTPTGGPLLLGKETNELIAKRAERCINFFADYASDGSHIAVITHGSYFGFLMRAALDIAFPESFCWQVDNCSVTRIVFRKNEIPKLAFSNYTGHLFQEPIFPSFTQFNQEVVK